MATENLGSKRTISPCIDHAWQAWSDGELVKQWWGPDGFSYPLAKRNFGEGGTSLVTMHVAAELHVPKERIGYIHSLSDKGGNKIDPPMLGMPANFPQVQRHVAASTDLGNGSTELTFTEYAWPESRMHEFSRMRMERRLDTMQQLLDQ